LAAVEPPLAALTEIVDPLPDPLCRPWFNVCLSIWLALKVSTRRSLILIGWPV